MRASSSNLITKRGPKPSFHLLNSPNHSKPPDMSTSQRRKPLFMPNPDPATIIVPGVDSNAPPAVQLEQIEQLITLRLAVSTYSVFFRNKGFFLIEDWYGKTIDDNLARSHQIITTQILPAVQRFARASQPTRDSARVCLSLFFT